MLGRDLPTTEPNTAVVAGGRGGKDDRKQNTLAPFYEKYIQVSSSYTKFL